MTTITAAKASLATAMFTVSMTARWPPRPSSSYPEPGAGREGTSSRWSDLAIGTEEPYLYGRATQ